MVLVLISEATNAHRGKKGHEVSALMTTNSVVAYPISDNSLNKGNKKHKNGLGDITKTVFRQGPSYFSNHPLRCNCTSSAGRAALKRESDKN